MTLTSSSTGLFASPWRRAPGPHRSRVLDSSRSARGTPSASQCPCCSPERRASLTALIFRETTTIGVRYRESEREVLDRETVVVATAVGPIRVKVARQRGEVLNVSPEFDDCVKLAAAANLPVKEVQALAVKAWGQKS